MNWPYLHLAFNHVPIIGVPIAFVLLVWGLGRGSRDLVRAACLGAVVFGLATVGTVQSGERAEHALEDAGVPWFNEEYIQEHEERAETTQWVALAAAALGLVGLGLSWGGRPVSSSAGWGAAGLLAITSVLLAWTALAGGEIRHDEFRGGAAPPAVEQEGP
jgi:hypothetical protein